MFVAPDTTLPAAGETLFATPLTAEPTPEAVLVTVFVACCTVLPEPPPPPELLLLLDEPVPESPPPDDEAVV